MSDIAGIGSLVASAVLGVTQAPPQPLQQPTLVEQKVEQAANGAGQSANGGPTGGSSSPLSVGNQTALLQIQEVGGGAAKQVQASAASTNEQPDAGLKLGDVLNQIV